MESFISTMETNALMGKNVARLIVDRMLGAEPDHASFIENIGDDGGQRVLQEEL
jgi:prenylcysteine oxidase/farnesylcysteine lyase